MKEFWNEMFNGFGVQANKVLAAIFLGIIVLSLFINIGFEAVAACLILHYICINQVETLKKFEELKKTQQDIIDNGI